MATQTAPPPEATQTPQPLPVYPTDLPTSPPQATPYRFTVAQYERMIAAGVFHEDERIELIEGEIIQMAAVGVRHATCIVRFNELLLQLVAGKFYVSPQNPIRLPDRSEPLPDLMVIERKEYAETPGVADVLFVVEVADTTLLNDRARKFPQYAAAGIREAWLVDLQACIVERHNNPQGGLYRQMEMATTGQSLASLVIPSVVIPVADILP